MSSFSDADRDATPVDPAGPVADTEPPAASGAGPLRPSAPPTGSTGPAGGPDDPAARDDDDSTDAASSAPPRGGGDAVAGGGDVEAAKLETEIESEIRELAAERDSFKDIAQRTLADFENYKKRVHAQIRDEADRATGRLVEALLPVFDAAEAAYVNHPDEVGPLLNLMLGELRKHGLEPLDLEGRPFDPSVADAVAHEPGDGGDVVVTEVLRSGYRWKDRTLRPAMVRTADRAPAGQDAAPDER